MKELNNSIQEKSLKSINTNEEKTVSLSEANKNISLDYYNTIVRIVAHGPEFDFELPFKILGNSGGSGTGFFIDNEGHILTCAHVVSDASNVYIEIPNEGKKQYNAEILGVCPYFDLAVVKIKDYKNKHYCPLDMQSDNVRSGDETFALGFPLGQDNLKVTKGIVSGQQMNMYQIDTPINPGNSGGPLIKNNKVIGVNGAGALFAQNIGYAVPITRYFMIKNKLHLPKKTLIQYPEVLGIEYQRTSEEFMDFFQHHCKKGGIYIKKVFRGSPISRTGIKEGDILSSLNGQAIDFYGDFESRWMNQKMTLQNMMATLPLNGKITIEFWQAKTKKMIKKHFLLTDYKLPIRTLYHIFDDIPFEVVGGLVVMPLTLNHLSWRARRKIRKYKSMENRDKPKLVISSILLGSYVYNLKVLKSLEVIKEVNDIKTTTIDEFRKNIVKCIKINGVNYIKILTEEHDLVVIPIKTIVEEEKRLQDVYKYKESSLVPILKKSCKDTCGKTKKASHNDVKKTAHKKSKPVRKTKNNSK